MLDPKDFQIISCLRKNSRMHLTDIARKTSLPVSTVADRVKRLNRFVLKYTSLTDFSLLDHPIRIWFVLSAKPALSSCLNSVYRLRNGFLVEGVFKNYNEAFDFSEKLGARLKKQFVVVEDIVREGFLC